MEQFGLLGLGGKKKEAPQPTPDGTRSFFIDNLDKETNKNKAYRRVLYTNNEFQIALQTLEPGERIPAETHRNGTQFFRVEKGKLAVTTSDRRGEVQIVEKDGALIVPAGIEHELTNASSGKTSFYTIYVPPQHEAGQVDQRMIDAIKREESESLRRQAQPSKPAQPPARTTGPTRSQPSRQPQPAPTRRR